MRIKFGKLNFFGNQLFPEYTKTVAVVIPNSAGFELTAGENRSHFTLSKNKLEFTLTDNRLHFKMSRNN